MKSAGTFRALLLVVLGSLGAHALGARGSQEVWGFYKVANATGLGSEVRGTLEIRLFNSTENRLLITKASLQVLPHSRFTAEEPVSSILEPHGNSEFTEEFIVSRAEYEFWQHGARLRLILMTQAAGSQERTLMAVLIRRSG
jgi:hypothetical protein